MRQLVIALTPLIDILCAPFAVVSALFLRAIRRMGVQRLPVCRQLLYQIGVFPIRDHYYEPLFNPARLRHSLRQARSLPGLNMNASKQLQLLEQFRYQTELAQLPILKQGERQFYYHNGAFESGDAEYLYNMIRYLKPHRLYEVGSGHSTLMARLAIEKNQQEQPDYKCEHICIEPFEEPWLEQLGVQVLRKKVEELDPQFFKSLSANDILFIDSSHMIRPQGDVLFEFLELLPQLSAGVYVHVHDIFTPHDYPDMWILNQVKFYNEQYLLEAFLSLNEQFEVVGALNYLAHFHRDQLGQACPIYGKESGFREPGSFWFRRVRAN